MKQLLDLCAEKMWNMSRNFVRQHIPQIKVMKPESTYMIGMDCGDWNMPGDALKDFFIKKAKLGFNDGRVFGTGGEGFMRMNVACPKATVEKAMDQLKQALNGNKAPRSKGRGI